MAERPRAKASGADVRDGRTVLLFGEVLMDHFPDSEVPGGAPFNVARHLHGLGHAAGIGAMLVTRIGKDARGQRLLEAMLSAGLPLDGVQQDCLHPSGEVRVDPGGEGRGPKFDIVPEQAWDFIHADLTRLVGLSVRPQWLYFGTLAQRAVARPVTRPAAHPALRALFQATRARGFLDINLRDPWVRKDVLRWSLAEADVVKMNEEELQRVSHMMGLGHASQDVLGKRLLHTFGIRLLLVTEGGDGAWMMHDDGMYHHTEPAAPVDGLIDSVGAGDGFAAVCLMGLVLGWPADQTLVRAHRFAGAICQLRGAVPECADFYQPFIRSWRLAGGASA